jgi:hypothetical protein
MSTRTNSSYDTAAAVGTLRERLHTCLFAKLTRLGDTHSSIYAWVIEISGSQSSDYDDDSHWDMVCSLV